MPHADPFAWLPFGLLPSARADGREQPEIVELRLPSDETDWQAAMRRETIETVGAWSVEIVMNRFRVQSWAWHTEAQARANPATRGPLPPNATKIREWINLTRALAAGMPLAGPAAHLMHAAADRLARVLAAPAELFTSWPPLGTAADYDRRATVNLWAMDRLVRAVNGTEEAGDGDITLAKFWPAMFDDPDLSHAEIPAFAIHKEAQKRIDRLDGAILPGRREALMVTMLAVVLRDWPETSEAPPATPPK